MMKQFIKVFHLRVGDRIVSSWSLQLLFLFISRNPLSFIDSTLEFHQDVKLILLYTISTSSKSSATHHWPLLSSVCMKGPKDSGRLGLCSDLLGMPLASTTGHTTAELARLGRLAAAPRSQRRPCSSRTQGRGELREQS